MPRHAKRACRRIKATCGGGDAAKSQTPIRTPGMETLEVSTKRWTEQQKFHIEIQLKFNASWKMRCSTWYVFKSLRFLHNHKNHFLTNLVVRVLNSVHVTGKRDCIEDCGQQFYKSDSQKKIKGISNQLIPAGFYKPWDNRHVTFHKLLPRAGGALYINMAKHAMEEIRCFARSNIVFDNMELNFNLED